MPQPPSTDRTTPRPRVIIVGGGFAGLAAAKALRDAPCDVIVIDRANHHTFQPLLYQVATAALTPADIAWPIRAILGGQGATQVLLAEVTAIDVDKRLVRTTGGDFAYDLLVLATGATHAYFGHDDWAAFAPGLKRLEDATAIRRRILIAFERAELSADPVTRQALTTFVVVGGGPTGVEMAGAIADVARYALPPDFRNVDPAQARILLIEAGPRILPSFPEGLSAHAAASLRRMGVEVLTGSAVTGIDAAGVMLGRQRIAAGAVIWAAGVQASPAARWLGAEADRAGRVRVGADLTLPGHPEVFVIGDTAAVTDAADVAVPGLAPAAKQMGDYAGRAIAARLRGASNPTPFRYRHQGDLATIGRKSAIVKLGRLTLTGFVGWAFWGLVHVYFLIGVRNRVAVASSWLWDYVTFGRRSRLIIDPAPD
ncbi:NAD(P)/FAD-dependent oxidoreductase [Phenylobacterium sp.]|uniref:NAD(P)/FAD-dependent oxidoreductase n=1 Tax=Phenylobacterium sp. TaxID=1871053 RepID=UPI002DE71836|nr:NAD(P)/FAD-dependent oxidoreductase [Phenylobacterium sp.]